MAEKLSVVIALEGAEEIKRQLADVGQAGQDAFKQINDAAAEVGGFNKLDPSVVQEKIAALGVKGPEAIDKINSAVKQAGKMETLINALTGVENGLVKVQAAALALDNVLGAALVNSVSKLARLLPLAFAAATVGAIVSTTKSLLELDAAAIKLGVSFADLAKAEGIFKAIGLSIEGAKEAARGFVAEQGKIELAGVKEAAANIDPFGRSASSAKDWFKILEEGAKSANKEVADLAQNKLRELGRTVPGISAVAQEIEKMQQSALPVPEKILAIIAKLEQMGPTAERTQIANKLFGPEFTQALNAGGVQLELVKEKLRGMPAPTQEAANAAARLSLEWEKLKQSFSITISPEALNAIAASLGQVRVAAEAVGRAIVAVNAAFISWLSGNLFSNTIRELMTIGSALASIGSMAASVWNALVQGATAAATGIAQVFANLPGQIVGFFANLGPNLWGGLVQGAQAAVQSIGQSFSALVQTITSAITGLGSGLLDNIVAGAQSAWNTIVGYIQTAINKAKEFAGMSGGAAGAGAQGRAHGGLIAGRGTGTSDSNLAWVSRGEHIMPAYAVRQPGVLQLLEALRRSGGNLRGVLDRMGHFALGGMVSAPAFASGGTVGGMSHVTIQFPGVQPITGLRASSAVVDELRRSAALAQVRSGGRKPSRYT